MALNEGLKESKGAYITKLDSDDAYHPKKIEFQLKFCKNNNIEACSCIIVRRKVVFNRVKYSKECNVSSIMFSRKVKVFKLITGEEIICRSERILPKIEDGQPTRPDVDVEQGDQKIKWWISQPMTLQAVPTAAGKLAYQYVPWLKTGKNEKIELTEDKVIAVDSPSEESEKNYLAKVTGLTL